jgi:hypothetical protein
MNSEAFPSPMKNQRILSASYTAETNFQQQEKKEDLTTKLRQTISAAGKRVQTARGRRISVPHLTDLTPQSQVR